MSKKLSAHYDNMWKKTRPHFENGICDIDSLIKNKEDHRRGVTLLARPSQVVIDEISHFQSELKKVDSNQYYQPALDLHMTVLSIISCYDGFGLNQIKPENYQQIISECITEPITIQFEGVTASASGILIQGYPEGDGLEKLRNGLRNKFKNSTLQHSIDSRYKISTAHITALRFRKSLTNPTDFVKLLDKFRSHTFGRIQISQLHLVFNDWYQRTEIVKELATFDLS